MNSNETTLPALPPLPRPGTDETTPAQRRAVVAAIVAVHGLGAWLAWQVPAVRTAVAHSAPMFVNLIAPEAPPVPPPPAPPPPPVPQPRIQKAPPPKRVIAAAPAPTPEPAFVVPVQPEEPPAPEPVVEAPPVPPAPPAAPAPPAPPPAPKEIPPSAIQYLEPPQPEYPRVSRRLGETGTVIVRVFVDEEGVPRNVQIAQSSGFARLDEAAAKAALKARFRPYTEGGRPTAGWARIPFPFELEK